jgi:hypothetical protein
MATRKTASKRTGTNGKSKAKRPPDKPQPAPADSPTQAMESGEPAETGRSHGYIIDERGAAAGERGMRISPDVDLDRESGRHGA